MGIWDCLIRAGSRVTTHSCGSPQVACVWNPQPQVILCSPRVPRSQWVSHKWFPIPHLSSDCTGWLQRKSSLCRGQVAQRVFLNDTFRGVLMFSGVGEWSTLVRAYPPRLHLSKHKQTTPKFRLPAFRTAWPAFSPFQNPTCASVLWLTEQIYILKLNLKV